MRAFSPWSRLLVFVGAHVLLLAGLYRGVVEPGLDFLREQERRIDASAAALRQANATLARERGLAELDPAEIEQARERFIAGDSLSLQEANLLTLLRQAAEPHGVSFSAVTTLGPRDWQGARLAGAQVEFTATTRQAAALLAGLEEGRPLLFIRRARLAQHRDGEGDADLISASIEVYGVTR
jgi:type II secretory pathway component PulM